MEPFPYARQPWWYKRGKSRTVSESFALVRHAGVAATAATGVLLTALALWPGNTRIAPPTWQQRLIRVKATIWAILSLVKSKSLRNMAGTAFLLAAVSRAMESSGVRHARRGRVTFRIFFASLWALYYAFRVVEAPVVKYRHDCWWNVHIVEKASLATRYYFPVFWAFNRHAQTVILYSVAHLEWMWDSISWRLQEIPCKHDGNTLDVYWGSLEGYLAGGRENFDFKSNATPVIVLVPGIGGDVDSPYIKRMTRSCARNGWRVALHAYWRLDFHDTKDLTTMLDTIAAENPSAPIVAVAFSAGGHLLLRYLQTAGKSSPLAAAVTVSGCFDLFGAITNVCDNENAAYELFLNAQVRTCVKRHIAHDIVFKPTLDAAGKIIAPKRDPVEFEAAVIGDAPIGGDAQGEYDRFLFHLGGYDGEAEAIAKFGADEPWELMKQTAAHYTKTAAIQMEKVKVATLILHADDDPIVSARFVDWSTVLENKHLITMHTRRGGHVAWYQGLAPFGADWGATTTVAFVSAVLETHAQTHFLLDVLRGGGEDGDGDGAEDGDGDRRRDTERLARITSKSDLATFRAGST